MKKNVAGQKVGAQMTTAADGTDFTGAVTVYVTVDAGTQAIGTVGSGVCTHEGKGYHTYAPSQAETNGDLLAFSFTGTGAITATPQIYTRFPQTGDLYLLLTAAAAEIAGVPAAAASYLDKLAYIFKKTRNKNTQTATTTVVFADDNTTPSGGSTDSFDGTTFTKGKDA